MNSDHWPTDPYARNRAAHEYEEAVEAVALLKAQLAEAERVRDAAKSKLFKLL